MTTTMVTYGRTLCWRKKNTIPNTGGVFAVGAKEHDSEHRRGVCCRGNLTRHGRYQREAIRKYAPGYRRGVLQAIRCTSRRDSSSQSLSYTWSKMVLLPDSFATVVPIGNSRSASSRERDCKHFRGEFFVLEAAVGCTDSTVHRNRRAVVC